jgi:hypothetical protein
MRPDKKLPDCHAERVDYSRFVAARVQRSSSSWQFLSSFPSYVGGMRANDDSHCEERFFAVVRHEAKQSPTGMRLLRPKRRASQ